MSYFQNLFSEFTELPIQLWLALVALIVFGALLAVLVHKKAAKKWMLLATGILMLVLAVLFVTALPTMEVADGSSDAAQSVFSIFYSAWFYAALFSLGGLAALVVMLRRVRFTARMLATAALCVAAGLVLSYIRLYRQPNGGSITPASMLPVLVLSYLYGPGVGIAGGLAHGMIQLFQGAYIVHPIQFLLDYILPFAMLGFCGFLRKNYTTFCVGVALGGLLRAIMHFLSGWIFWGASAPAGQHPAIYSLLYTAGYMLPEMGICLLIVLLPPIKRVIQKLKDNVLHGW